MSERNELVRLYRFIIQHYDLDEIRTLCFNLSVIYDDLSGDRLSTKVRELLVRLGHDRRLNELLDELAAMRPIPFEKAQFEKNEAYLDRLYGALPNFVEYAQTSNLEQQESLVFTLLAAALIIVWFGYGFHIFSNHEPFILLGLLLALYCFPAIFVPASIVGLLTGFRLNSRRIKILSIALGASAGILYLTIFVLKILRFITESTTQFFGPG